MPIILQLDEVSGCVCSTAHGIVAVEEIEAHVQAKAAADVLSKPEVFDARDVTLDLSVEDLKHIAAVVRETMGSMKPGPIAIVTNSGFIECLARAYAAMAVKQNPGFRVFNALTEARDWAARQAARLPSEKHATARPML
jgi:hypothetical protein